MSLLSTLNIFHFFFFVISIADFKQAIVCWIRIEWANKSSRRIESKTKQLEVVVINLKILLGLMFKYFSYCFFTFTQVIYWLLISLFFKSKKIHSGKTILKQYIIDTQKFDFLKACSILITIITNFNILMITFYTCLLLFGESWRVGYYLTRNWKVLGSWIPLMCLAGLWN